MEVAQLNGNSTRRSRRKTNGRRRGYGFAREMMAEGDLWPLLSIYRDAKIGEIYEGANEVQKWVIARAIFGRDIKG